MRLMIASAEEMHVIGRYQANAQVSRNRHQRSIAQFLYFHPMVVKFDEEICRAENIPVFGGALFCLLDVICLNRAIDFARKTAAESDQTLGARGQHLLVDTRRVMKSIQM